MASIAIDGVHSPLSDWVLKRHASDLHAAQDLAVLQAKSGGDIEGLFPVPNAVLCKPGLFSLLLKSGLQPNRCRLYTFASPPRCLRSAALMENAPLLTHDILDQFDVPGVLPNEVMGCFLTAVDHLCFNSLQYLHDAYPDRVESLFLDGPALATMLVLQRWASAPGRRKPCQAMRLAHDWGAHWPVARAWLASRQASKLPQFDALVGQFQAEDLAAVSPMGPVRPQPGV